MLVIAVVPCLDEEKGVESVCRSLGFGPGAEQPGVEAVLVLVDNASRDGTFAAMGRVASGSTEGSVRVVREPCLGFVPARHRGAVEAQAVAAERGTPELEVLLVQADADTSYEHGYLAKMAACSSREGEGVLIEGYSEAALPSDEFAAYRDLEERVDAAVSGALLGGALDVVVDDKVAALRLSDYLAWGGHRREWGRNGDEILAETTRLYLRGRLRGGSRHFADAYAWTSIRRTVEDPGLAFATAGHPRGPRWRSEWSRTYSGPSTVSGFGAPLSREAAVQLVRARAMHLVALFRLLPEWTSASLASPEAARHPILGGSPAPDVGRESPGAVVDWAMSRTWEETAEVLGEYVVSLERLVSAATSAGYLPEGNP